MWVDTACVSVSRFYSHNEEQKQLLQKTMSFCLLEINRPFDSSKMISATSCWVLKSKGTLVLLTEKQKQLLQKVDFLC